MINLQVRGTKSEINIGSITDTIKDRLLNEIKEKKISFCQVPSGRSIQKY